MVLNVVDRTNHMGSLLRLHMKLHPRRTILLAVTSGLVLCTLLGYMWYRGLERQYAEAKQQAATLHYGYGAQGQLSPGDLPRLTEDLVALEANLRGLQDRVDIPVVSSVARHTPYVGEQYRAVEDLLQLSVELTAIARETSQIANEVRTSIEVDGIQSTEASQTSWLDVALLREEDIRRLEYRFQQSVALRGQIDEDALPPRGVAALETADLLIVRATLLRDEYFHLLPLLGPAFGRDQDAHYLILLQNGEEIRQSGGFPGTYAMLTLRNGRILSVEIDDIRTLDWAYHDGRDTPIPSPGPIRTYLRQEEWLPHDALWSPDFAEAAQSFLNMYEHTGWPELVGVIGVNHPALKAVLEAIGPFDIEIEGKPYHVQSDNLLDIIEAHRDLTWADLAAHKRVVSQLGTALVGKMSAADFETKKAIYFGLRDDADRREIQMYMVDPRMQAEVVRRGWHGSLTPDPDVPTLAVTVSSVAGGKASTKIYPQSTLEIEQDSASGKRFATWTINLQHWGDPNGDQTYHGFQRLWVSVYIPDGARVTKLSRAPEPSEITDDERAIGFNIGIMPGTTESIQITMELSPDIAALLFRRQAGLNDTMLTANVSLPACQMESSWTAIDDLRLDLEGCSLQFALK